MDAIFKQILSEQGLIYLMFFISFITLVWKGFPALYNIYEKQQESFLLALKQQQENFKEDLEKISQTFLSQIEKSDAWHEQHNAKLDEIKDSVNKIISR